MRLTAQHFCEKFDWQLQAWVVFPNHYHFVGVAPSDASTLSALIKELHLLSSSGAERRESAAKAPHSKALREVHMADPMEFSNRVGVELHEFEVKRASEELSGVSGFDRFSSMLGATLIATANVLRDPIEAGMDAEDRLDSCTRWLRAFLQPAIEKGREESVT